MKALPFYFCYSRLLGYNWLPALLDCINWALRAKDRACCHWTDRPLRWGMLMGSCVGTCLTGGPKTERERGFVACGGKLHLVGYLWEAARARCVCVFVCQFACVNSFFSPLQTLVRDTAAWCDTSSLALVTIWLQDERKKVVGWDSAPLRDFCKREPWVWMTK